MDEGLSRAEVLNCFRSEALSDMLTPVFRDIPLPLVSSGCENSGNLRELALNRMKDFGAECRDVRFREVGVRSFLSFLSLSLHITPLAFNLVLYPASISMCNPSIIILAFVYTLIVLSNSPFMCNAFPPHTHFHVHSFHSIILTSVF